MAQAFGSGTNKVFATGETVEVKTLTQKAQTDTFWGYLTTADFEIIAVSIDSWQPSVNTEKTHTFKNVYFDNSNDDSTLIYFVSKVKLNIGDTYVIETHGKNNETIFTTYDTSSSDYICKFYTTTSTPTYIVDNKTIIKEFIVQNNINNVLSVASKLTPERLEKLIALLDDIEKL